MKKIVLPLVLALAGVPLLAAPADVNALRNYLVKAMPKCPDSKITVEPIGHVGPAGFIPYSATQTSSDTSCGAQKVVLYSPSTNQVIIGTVFALSPENRSVEERVAEMASDILKRASRPRWEGFRFLMACVRLADKGHAVRSVLYHGFVDSAQRFSSLARAGISSWTRARR